MKVIVNDANILIDLVELKLLPHFFALEFEFLTTELVLAELFEEQYQSLLPYIDNGQLIVHEMTGEDLTEIYLLQASKPRLSEQDLFRFLSSQKKHRYAHHQRQHIESLCQSRATGSTRPPVGI